MFCVLENMFVFLGLVSHDFIQVNTSTSNDNNFLLLFPIFHPFFIRHICYAHLCENFCRAKHFCAVVAEPYESKTNVLHIRFFANKNITSSKFKIYYSTFRKKGDGCAANELDCDDDTCISIDLKCNDVNNCKFQKDEEDCKDVCILCTCAFP